MRQTSPFRLTTLCIALACVTGVAHADESRWFKGNTHTHSLWSDGNDFPVLVIQQDFNRAWIAVGDALANTNLVIDDRNRSLGIFYLMYGKDQDGEDLQYELKLNRAENGVQVAVQINDEQIAPRDVSDLILGKVIENL